MIFIDGVGIGKEDYQNNPFFKFGFKTFEKFLGAIPSNINPQLKSNNCILFPVDACMGVEGLPQSGTGQTSIFCGVNAPELIGMHFGPYPYSALLPVIRDKNIFKSFLDRKLKVTFANAYPRVFFDYIKSGKKRLSVTTLMCQMNKMRLRKANDVRKGTALTAEITNERWNQKLGYKLPLLSPEKAADRLLKISSKNNFTLYEYFLTDHIGHGRYSDEFELFFRTLDRFLYQVLNKINHETTTLIVCSDHGNLEDISIKSHTLNPALMIAAGRKSDSIFNKTKSLSQIKNSVLDLID
ncbi:MAG: alkaline phosphatase family protein [Ignavibacteriaceae bacterium]|nr:alkaline phosphatase family protein [Ignavibacteriaceae bacterium]